MKPFARRIAQACALTLAALCSLPAHAQQPDPAAMLAKQKAAMARFDYLQGTWRGPAWMIDGTGTRHEMVQTERMGAMLGDTVKMIEGRGYAPDGNLVFNALAVLSYDLAKSAYSLRSWGQGRSGEFAFAPTADGYIWSTPAGPNATIRYTAVFAGDSWRETGEYVMEGRPPRAFFEMNLKRIGNTDWPQAGLVPMR